MNTSGVASALRGDAVPSGAARGNATRGNGVGPRNDADLLEDLRRFLSKQKDTE